MYVVNKGFAFTSKRRMLQEGDEVTEKDFVSHDAFIKAVAKDKIVVGKSKDQIAAEAKVAAEKAQAEKAETDKTEKETAVKTAKQMKETAEAALKAAKDRLTEAEKGLETANTARADAEAKVTPAQETLTAAEKGSEKITLQRKAVADAEAELAKAKKPEAKAAAEKYLAEAKADLLAAGNDNTEYRAALDAFKAVESGLEKAETDKTEAEAKLVNAKEAVALAEAELEKAAASFAALEGK
jgi:colicin import membrane protein